MLILAAFRELFITRFDAAACGGVAIVEHAILFGRRMRKKNEIFVITMINYRTIKAKRYRGRKKTAKCQTYILTSPLIRY